MIEQFYLEKSLKKRLTDSTTSDQSGPGFNENEDVLHISQTPRLEPLRQIE